MKRILPLLILFFIASASKAQLPNINVRDLDKNWISLPEMKGEKLTIVDFWATWCKPCVLAIPKLNEIYQDYSGRGVNFVSVNVDGPRNQAKVKPFAKAMGVSYPILLDPNQELVNELNVSAYPTLIVFNSKGKEVFVHEGFNLGDEKIIREELEKLLEQ